MISLSDMDDIQLTQSQRDALAQVEASLSLHPEQPALLTGLAGSGKTTCMGFLARSFAAPLFLAPTNRAALVLRSKLPAGSRVSTVHAACMTPVMETHKEQIAHLQEQIRTSTDDEQPELVRQLRQAERDNEIVFKYAPGEMGPVSHVIVDEASMLTTEHVHHIRRAFSVGSVVARDGDAGLKRPKRGAQDRNDRVPLLFVGDPGQLPPIISDSEKAQGVKAALDSLEPTAELTEILRQAADSRVLKLAHYIRSRPKALRMKQFAGKVEDGELTIVKRPISGVTKGLLRQFDEILGEMHNGQSGIILTRRNDTRRTINRGIRDIRGFDGPISVIPQAGERLIVVNAPSRGRLERGEVQDPVTGVLIESDNPLYGCTKGTLCEVLRSGLENDGRGYQWIRLVIRPDGQDETALLSVPAGEFLKTYNEQEGDTWAFAERGWYELDYGYCTTVHKCQGSEFARVAVFEQAAPWQENAAGFRTKPSAEEHKQWAYTAATRASKRLLWVAMP